MKTKITMDNEISALFNRNEKVKEISMLICNNYPAAEKLYKEWCLETHNGEVPFTRMAEWENHCKEHNVSPTKIDYFCSWAGYFYTHGGMYSTYENLDDAVYNGEFDHCIHYYLETYERYTKMMAMLNKEQYIINSNAADIYI